MVSCADLMFVVRVYSDQDVVHAYTCDGSVQVKKNVVVFRCKPALMPNVAFVCVLFQHNTDLL